jgi:drug/metabolite transporter (DMT)-like permease
LRRWIAAFIGLSGALLILRPGSGEVPLASFLVLGSSVCNAFYQVLSRSLAARDSAETSITYIAVVGFLFMSILAPFDWKTPDNWIDGLLLVSLGLFGGFGHYYIVKAFQWGPASVVAPLNYGQLLGAGVLSAIVFGEIPGLLSWIGAAIIVGSGLFILYTGREPPPRRA